MTAALIAAAILGMSFGPTRWLGIGATALLTFAYPWLIAVVIVATAATFYVSHLRK